MPLFGLSVNDVKKMEAKRDIKGLIKALAYKKDTDVPYAAADSLEKIGEQAVDGLIAVLKDQDSDLRKYAANSLGKIGNARALDGLVVALKDPDEDVRECAAGALKNRHKYISS